MLLTQHENAAKLKAESRRNAERLGADAFRRARLTKGRAPLARHQSVELAASRPEIVEPLIAESRRTAQRPRAAVTARVFRGALAAQCRLCLIGDYLRPTHGRRWSPQGICLAARQTVGEKVALLEQSRRTAGRGRRTRHPNRGRVRGTDSCVKSSRASIRRIDDAPSVGLRVGLVGPARHASPQPGQNTGYDGCVKSSRALIRQTDDAPSTGLRVGWWGGRHTRRSCWGAPQPRAPRQRCTIRLDGRGQPRRYRVGMTRGRQRRAATGLRVSFYLLSGPFSLRRRSRRHHPGRSWNPNCGRVPGVWKGCAT